MTNMITSELEAYNYNDKVVVSWSNLPEALLYLVSLKLSAPEFSVFRRVCKSWRCIKNPTNRPLSTNNSSLLLDSEFPVLITIHRNFCTFFNPIHNATYKRVIPELFEAIICYSKREWLLLTRTETESIFFFNISTMTKIELPMENFPRDGGPSVSMYFSSTPDSTTDDCRVVAVDYGDCFASIKLGESKWQTCEFHENFWFAPYCRPIIMRDDGLCYCLRMKGGIGEFDPTNSSGYAQTKIVAKPPKVVQDWMRKKSQTALDQCYLVQQEECSVLLAVYIRQIDCAFRVYVYEFDTSKRNWRKVKSLGNKMMFISSGGGCVVMETPYTFAKNKIYFPITQMGNALFYSFDTGQIHSFLDHHDEANTKQILPPNSGWIGPVSSSLSI